MSTAETEAQSSQGATMHTATVATNMTRSVFSQTETPEQSGLALAIRQFKFGEETTSLLEM